MTSMCLICNLDLDQYKTSQVQYESIQRLIERSRTIRKDNLAEALTGLTTVKLHRECRNKYLSDKYNKFKIIKPFPTPRDEPSTEILFEYIPTIQSYRPARDKPLPDNDKGIRLATGSERDNVERNLQALPVLEPNSLSKSNDGTKSGTDFKRDPNKPFPFQTKCFLCAKDVYDKEKDKKFKTKPHSHVTKKQRQDNIIRFLSNNPSPKSVTILQHIRDVDLVEVKAAYHHKCYAQFKRDGTPKGKPKIGVPAMERIYRFIDESKHTQFKSTELMSEAIHGDNHLPDFRTIKVHLEKHYGERFYYTKVGVVTILKESSSGVNRFYKPWNLNDNGLGGQIEEEYYRLFTHSTCIHSKINKVEQTSKNQTKRKKARRRPSIELQGDEAINLRKETPVEKDNNIKIKTRSQMKREDNNKTSNKEDTNYEQENQSEIDIKEECDNEFIDDTFHSDDDTKDIERNALFCRICFSSDRKLDDLGKYRNVFQNICSSIEIQDLDTESKLFLVCWECKAQLRNVENFQEKIKIAQNSWNTEIQPQIESLSTLCMTSPDILSISNVIEEQNIACDVPLQDNGLSPFLPQMTEQSKVNLREPKLVVVDKDLPTEEDGDFSSLKEDENVAEINKIGDETFNDDTHDFDCIDDSKDQEDDKFLNYTSDNETKDMDTDDGPLEHQDKDFDDTSDKETKNAKTVKKPLQSSKLKVSQEAEDPDWETEEMEHYSKKKHKGESKQQIKIRYTVIAQTYETETKIKLEPIEPHELQHWLDTERNSNHFKSLTSKQKCIKCISKVPENHNQLCHSKAYPYVCKICESTLPSEYELVSHEANHYYIFSCEFCPYKCYNETHMRNHVETHRQLVQCLECFAAFVSLEKLTDHFSMLHQHADCDYCGKQFSDKSSVLNHITRSHAKSETAPPLRLKKKRRGPPQKCQVCNGIFKSKDTLRSHMTLKHHVERTEATYCVQCDKQYDNETQFNTHIRTSKNHINEWDESRRISMSKVECPECHKVYSCHKVMKQHYDLVHAKKINFYCKICDKAFVNNQKYRRHVKVKHEGYKAPKNKICQFCGRGFTTKKILENHIRTHTGERPFACPHCPSSFAQKVALRSHIAHIHEKRQRTTATKPTDFTKPSTSTQEPPSLLDYDF